MDLAPCWPLRIQQGTAWSFEDSAGNNTVRNPFPCGTAVLRRKTDTKIKTQKCIICRVVIGLWRKGKQR